jgi:hypothetical protein
MKICSNCKIEKPLSYFANNRSTKDGLSYECKECCARWRESNKSYMNEWRQLNKDKLETARNKYRKEKAERLKLARKEYWNKNKEVLKKRYKIKNRLRTRIRDALKGRCKSSSTTKLTGCSLLELKNHLQYTAIKNGYVNFDIDTYSGYDYHIDHITPISKFNLECSYHQRLCFNWSNLQILSSRDNLSKGNK